jgi:3-hydroxyisobutyrate dehydrogenase-like beta-hydroxyacid dehydrogenase
MGQVMKACLQLLIGSILTATFEAVVLAAKSGVSGKALFDVFTNSSKTRFPGEDNWAVTKVVEDIVGAKFAW